MIRFAEELRFVGWKLTSSQRQHPFPLSRMPKVISDWLTAKELRSSTSAHSYMAFNQQFIFFGVNL